MAPLLAFTPFKGSNQRLLDRISPTRAARQARRQTVPAQLEGCQAPLDKHIKVIGCGSSGVDYLASVAAFPKPDEKLRTEALEVQGGGNCANALTAAARLGLKPTIVTKIGGDGLGDGIISELQSDGVGTELVLRAAGHPSPFTYIIVDRQGGTRTCIHTPGAPMSPLEMTQDLIQKALDGAALVYFDGRLTQPALLLARAARAAGIPVLVEGERLRPGLQELLQQADYVVTSAHFPQEWTGEQCIGDAILEVANRLPNARMIITTLGTKGSVCLLRQKAEGNNSSLQDIIHHLTNQLQAPSSSSSGGNGASNSTVCVSSNGTTIGLGHVASTAAPVRLTFSSSRDVSAAAAFVKQAADRAAALNAEAEKGQDYAMVQTATLPTQQVEQQTMDAQVFVATTASLPADAVVDTTGAGDSFIGSALYGITTGMSPDRIMLLGAVVAACKCTALGARPGLPQRSQLKAELLSAS